MTTASGLRVEACPSSVAGWNVVCVLSVRPCSAFVSDVRVMSHVVGS